MIKAKETISTKAESAEVCQAIGSAVVGLYFLSSEAKKDNIEGLSSIIDAAIAQTIGLGCDMHQDKLKTDFRADLYAMLDDACVFIDRYCDISDVATKRNLASIVKSAQEDR